MNRSKSVSVIGTVEHAPEIRSTVGGLFSATFRIQATYTGKDREGNSTARVRHHIIFAVGDAAIEIRNTVRKGAVLSIDGKLQTQRWETKSAGETKFLTVILLDRFAPAQETQPSLPLAA